MVDRSIRIFRLCTIVLLKVGAGRGIHKSGQIASACESAKLCARRTERKDLLRSQIDIWTFWMSGLW